MTFSHQHWMQEAIDLAKEVESDLPIAAVIIKDNEIIGRGINNVEHSKDVTAHAEMLAIQEASIMLGDWRLTGCALYTTLEPCSMCMGAILNARIPKLIYGAHSSVDGACSTKLNLAHELEKDNQIEIIGGILEEETSKLLKETFKESRKSPSTGIEPAT